MQKGQTEKSALFAVGVLRINASAPLRTVASNSDVGLNNTAVQECSGLRRPESGLRSGLEERYYKPAISLCGSTLMVMPLSAAGVLAGAGVFDAITGVVVGTRWPADTCFRRRYSASTREP